MKTLTVRKQVLCTVTAAMLSGLPPTLCAPAEPAASPSEDPGARGTKATTSVDSVSASFERMLAHEPTTESPPAPKSASEDPLRKAISAVLWQSQSPSYHVASHKTPIGPRRFGKR